MAELGIVAATGMTSIAKLVAILRDDAAAFHQQLELHSWRWLCRSRDLTARIEALDNLDLVFGERDPGQRILAIRNICDENAELHEAEGPARGHEAISQAVTKVL